LVLPKPPTLLLDDLLRRTANSVDYRRNRSPESANTSDLLTLQ
jgi:hypothetical protein